MPGKDDDGSNKLFPRSDSGAFISLVFTNEKCTENAKRAMKNNLDHNEPECDVIMDDARINQLVIEINTWKRYLNFFREENVCLKNRLSDILKNGFDRSLLEHLEDFQSKFITHDDVITLLKNDIAAVDKLIKEATAEKHDMEAIGRKMDHLRSNMITSQKEFCELQLNFNTFISGSPSMANTF